jgi:hypothetical protein
MGEVCFMGPLEFEGGETETDPPLMGGRTGEVCLAGPPTAFGFAGAPPTELCANAGWETAFANAPVIRTISSAPFLIDASFHAGAAKSTAVYINA